MGIGSTLVPAAFVPIPWDDLARPIVGATISVRAWKFLAYVFRILDAARPRKSKALTSSEPGAGADS